MHNLFHFYKVTEQDKANKFFILIFNKDFSIKIKKQISIEIAITYHICNFAKVSPK